MNAPKVSIVIPTFQRRAALERALCALDTQTAAPTEYEVIVVVDGSTDATREMLATLHLQYHLCVLLQPNRGRATACNSGIHSARGDVIILLDDDMQAEPQLVREHLAAHSEAANLGVMGAAPIEIRDDATPALHYVATKFNEHMSRLGTPGYEMKLRDIYTGNFSIRRDVLLQVGAFDSQFQIYGNEDLELAVRLMRAGIRLEFQPNARAWQHYDKDFAGLARDHISKGKTSVQLASKHPEIVDQLKIAHASDAPRWWRAVRFGLLASGRFFPGTPQVLVRLLQFAETRPRWQRSDVYARALDYFYWLGVAQAREARA